MPWQPNGTFTRETPVATGTVAWADTKTAGDVNITTTDHDFHDQDLAVGIQQSLNVNGLNAALADINFGGFRVKSIAAPTAAADATSAVTIQKSAVNWAAAGGTSDAITATYAPAVTALTDGMLLGVRIASANTTATPTFAPNGLTARTITKNGGLALVASDLRATAEPILRYNLASTRWEIVGTAATASPSVYDSIGGGTLVAFTPYEKDTTAGTLTDSLPASPSVGDRFIVSDAGGVWNTNNYTINANGNSINGSVQNLVCNINNGGATVTCIAAHSLRVN